MITGAHFLLYSTNPEGDRKFFRDVLNFRAVDVGGGWLIFALPPAEMAVHPGSGNFAQLQSDHQLAGAVMYLMCDDLRMVIQSLEQRKISCTPVSEAQWGITTTIRLPSGSEIGLYQPKHSTAIGLGSADVGRSAGEQKA
jgi:hypothetical protein